MNSNLPGEMKENAITKRENYAALINEDAICVDEDYFVGVLSAVSEIENYIEGKG